MRLLLIDDDTSAAMIARAALEESWARRSIQGEITVCFNGVEAIAYLQQAPTLPHVILSDLKMPRIGGLELLKILKANARFLKIPVVIITTSNNPSDINAAWERQCAGYVLKVASYEEFADNLDKLQQSWEAMRLPHV
ncbi:MULTISPECIES: response regulator [Trichocoleus]|uniref:Response regulator n=1 Tax=Trichocoleus desertorum GB2-A4 TaxID=2933944 RepID=A0ABV0JEX6_9CYAN|nr:response regulator [Trichocoleus sp. FACHB-46]